MITNFKTFEEIKYTSEHIKLVAKVRYALNKFFGKNCCGVSKVRTVKSEWYDRYTRHYDYVPYTGTTILFSISIPSYIQSENIPDYELKLKHFKKLLDELKIQGDYENSNSFDLTEEQMIELLNRMKYLETLVNAEKYNL